MDHDPPFVNKQLGIGYDLLNGSLRGRAIGFTLRKKWWLLRESLNLSRAA